MTTEPTLSVVIPCFDYERYIGAAIDSVLANIRPADEIVVVDDGSRDRSAEIVAGYESVTLVQKLNGGMASAVNAGISAASGDVIVLLDADDLMAPDRLAWVASAFRDPEVVMAWHRLTVVDADGADRGVLPPTSLPGGDLTSRLVDHGFTSFAVTSGVALRRTTLAQIGPVPEEEFRNFAESFLIRAAPFLGRVAATDESHGTYRVHGESDMHGEVTGGVETMTAKLAKLLRMADTEQQLLCDRAVAAGLDLTLGQLHSLDTVYRSIFLAHARLSSEGRLDAWRRGRSLDLDQPTLQVRLATVARLVLYVVLPKGVLVRHQQVASGASGLTGLTRIWSIAYWKVTGWARSR